jgi:hypothetical protein
MKNAIQLLTTRAQNCARLFGLVLLGACASEPRQYRQLSNTEYIQMLNAYTALSQTAAEQLSMGAQTANDTWKTYRRNASDDSYGAGTTTNNYYAAPQPVMQPIQPMQPMFGAPATRPWTPGKW